MPSVFAADEAESAPSSIEELRAAAKQEAEASPVHAKLATLSDDTDAVSADADEITPIDEAGSVAAAEPSASEGPNMLAEAAPPALVSTGIEDSEATVTSASGIDVTERRPHHLPREAVHTFVSIL